MTTHATTLTVQKWGNSLAVRIPASIARTAHFHIGTPVKLIAHDDSIIVESIGEKRLSLAERLALFDPKKHGGEIMASELIGREQL